MNFANDLDVNFGAEVIRGAKMGFGRRLENIWQFEAYKPFWFDEAKDLLGLDLFLKFEQVLKSRDEIIPVSHLIRFLQTLKLPQVEIDQVILPQLIWSDSFANLVVNAGLDDSLDKHLKGSAYTAAWYVGLTGGTPSVAAGDTMASHAGWTEVTAYTEANRQTLTLGTVSSQSVDNSASKASFSINADTTTIGGGFVADNNTKGGSTGTLYGGGAFTAGNKLLDNGDTLNVTVTLTASAS